MTDLEMITLGLMETLPELDAHQLRKELLTTAIRINGMCNECYMLECQCPN